MMQIRELFTVKINRYCLDSGPTHLIRFHCLVTLGLALVLLIAGKHNDLSSDLNNAFGELNQRCWPYSGW